jgi:ATP-binding protein involved in chromosome partitioning
MTSLTADARQEQIRSAIAAVRDPDLDLSFEELKAIHDIKISGNTVDIYLTLIQPLHFAAEAINMACRQALYDIVPSADINIYVQEAQQKVQPNRILPGVKNLIAVASGKGGVGKSTITANLAAGLAKRGAKVGLIDADVHGPSIPTMFGLEGRQLEAEKTEDGQIIGYPHERFDVQVASIGFILGRDQAAILRGPMQAGYFKTLVEQIRWGDLDYLLFDLPPGTGDIQLTLTQTIPLTGAVIVTTPQDIALTDVRRGISMFNRVNVEILGVVENMSYYVCPSCGHREDIFSHGGGTNIAKELDAPFLGELPLNMKVREGGDEGMPVVLNREAPHQSEAVMKLARNMVAEIRRKNFRDTLTPTVQISL